MGEGGAPYAPIYRCGVRREEDEVRSGGDELAFNCNGSDVRAQRGAIVAAATDGDRSWCHGAAGGAVAK